ncbi:ABC transporter permease [Actinoallomurus oryzae]|uniref:Autoinducer 2 import system permease protein LsrD n=2 Tax=Actinoallomurus oryzae TaxID=502180 RepID=A0ABP8QZL5_9ACTN
MTAATQSVTDRSSFAGARMRIVTSLGGIVIVLVAAAILTPSFYGSANLNDLFRQIGFIGVAAIGQTFVLLVAGIDLSVGAMLGLAMVVSAQLTGGHNDALAVAVLAALGLGLLGGALNAGLVVGRRVPPFVATFATFTLIEGGISAWTKGSPSGQVPPGLSWVGAKSIAGVPTPILIFVVLLAVAAFVLGRTSYGRRVYATGANPAASRLSGVPVRAVVTSTYLISAVLALIAGLMTSGYTGYVDNYLSHNLNLDSIAAAVVGGTALTGGKGGVGRTTIGVVLIAVLIDFLGLLGVGNAGQLLIEGAVILGAVWLQGRGRSAAQTG